MTKPRTATKRRPPATSQPEALQPIAETPALPGLELDGDHGLGVRATTGPIDATATVAHLVRLGKVGATWRWIIGDLVIALANDHDGDLAAAWRQIADLDIDTQSSLMRSVAVAKAVPYERRRPGLSWSHHQAVAGLDPDQQTLWLTRAVDDHLTVRQLEDAIADHLAGPEQQGELLPPAPKPFTLPAPVLARVEAWAGHDDDAVLVLRRRNGHIVAEEVQAP